MNEINFKKKKKELPITKKLSSHSITKLCIDLKNGRYRPEKVKSDHSEIYLTKDIVKTIYSDLQEMCAFCKSIFDKLNIRYVMANGSLIEIIRGKCIINDDDIDIRIHKDDVDKLMKYGQNFVENKDGRFYDKINKDMFFDGRICNKDSFCDNGVQLFSVKNKFIHCDIIPADVEGGPWIDYSMAFDEPLRNAIYKNIHIKIPSKKMTNILLKTEYGVYSSPMIKTFSYNNNIYCIDNPIYIFKEWYNK